MKKAKPMPKKELARVKMVVENLQAVQSLFIRFSLLC